MHLTDLQCFTLAQKGHPLPRSLLSIVASHSCPHSPNHQTFFPECGLTISGVRVPFLVGCHSLASIGLMEAKSVSPVIASLPRQYGHLVPLFLLEMVDSHSCSHSPSHQTFFWLPIVISSGAHISTFFSKSHSFIKSGLSNARIFFYFFLSYYILLLIFNIINNNVNR